MSNTKKKPLPKGHSATRSPKTAAEKRSNAAAEDQGVKPRGKRSTANLPSDWDDMQSKDLFKKQNKGLKPKRDTIRKGEEDEEMKKTITDKQPKVKDRKKLTENVDICKFIECVLTKNYADANKYLHSAIESKLQARIEQELTTPLFQ